MYPNSGVEFKRNNYLTVLLIARKISSTKVCSPFMLLFHITRWFLTELSGDFARLGKRRGWIFTVKEGPVLKGRGIVECPVGPKPGVWGKAKKTGYIMLLTSLDSVII